MLKYKLNLLELNSKIEIPTKTKCLALSIFSFVFGDEIGKHSSLSKQKQ